MTDLTWLDQICYILLDQICFILLDQICYILLDQICYILLDQICYILFIINVTYASRLLMWVSKLLYTQIFPYVIIISPVVSWLLWFLQLIRWEVYVPPPFSEFGRQPALTCNAMTGVYVMTYLWSTSYLVCFLFIYYFVIIYLNLFKFW